jgi:hypothetical protein
LKMRPHALRPREWHVTIADRDSCSDATKQSCLNIMRGANTSPDEEEEDGKESKKKQREDR